MTPGVHGGRTYRQPDAERFDPGVVEENVSLCDLADIPVPENVDSRSLVPLLEGRTDEWHSEYDDEVVSQDVGNGCVAGGIDSEHLMIKRDHLKYRCYGGDDEVLFDLATDPEESTNVVDEQEHADAVEAFRARRAELGYGPDAVTEYRNAGIGNLNGSATRNLGVLLAD